MAEKKTKKQTETKKAAKTARKSVKKTATKKSTVKKSVAKKVEKKEVAPKKRVEKDVVVFAHSKYIRSSARKARLVIDMVRGRNAQDVTEELKFSDKEIAMPIRKTIVSAIANAVNNFELDRDKLVIVEAVADEAPTYKRGRAGSRGRYKKLLKRNCHIKIGVSQK